MRTALVQTINTYLALTFVGALALGAGHFVYSFGEAVIADIDNLSLAAKYGAELERQL